MSTCVQLIDQPWSVSFQYIPTVYTGSCTRYTPRVATRRAHSSNIVDDMLVTLLSGHKYYITFLYFILQQYCWKYKSKLNINIQECCISPILQVSMHVRLGDKIPIIQFTDYSCDHIL